MLASLFGGCFAQLGQRGTENPQLLLLGLDGAGKTTLLYKLRVGAGWKTMEGDMQDMRRGSRLASDSGVTQDPGYHCEDFNRVFNHSILDVPGTQAMRATWPFFYKAIKVHGVIFLVNAEDPPAKMELAKAHLHMLLHEIELRNAAFMVVVNTREPSKTKRGHDEEDEVFYKLGLHQLDDMCMWRTRKFTLNVATLRGDADAHWLQVLEFARETLMDERGYAMHLLR